MKKLMLFLFIFFLFHGTLLRPVNQKNIALGILGITLFGSSVGYSAIRHATDWKQHARLSSEKPTIEKNLHELNNNLHLGDKHSDNNGEIIRHAHDKAKLAKWCLGDTSPFIFEKIYENFNFSEPFFIDSGTIFY